jgi:hypothetical protein
VGGSADAGRGVTGRVVIARGSNARGINLVKERPLFAEGKRRDEPGRTKAVGGVVVRRVGGTIASAVGKIEEGVVIVLQAQAKLLDIVAATHPPGGLAGCLDGRQKEGDQHPDDGDDDEQLHEREGPDVPNATPDRERLHNRTLEQREEEKKNDALLSRHRGSAAEQRPVNE